MRDPSTDTDARARRVLDRCAELATCTDRPGMIHRLYATAAHARARELLVRWMREAGMTVHVDAVGNVIGDTAGTDTSDSLLVLGSHYDTVPDGGAFDGPLGVLVAVECVAQCAATAVRVVAFADEEGVRFGTSFLGSSAVVGRLPDEIVSRRDDAGVTLGSVLPGEARRLTAAAWPPDRVSAFVEVHIEQGPMLEALDQPLGIVTHIAAQSRAEITFAGQAGHAGTVPMTHRRDALAAAAEFVLEVERTALERPGLVATVGELDVHPGAVNVIAGGAEVSLDVRHGDTAECEDAFQALLAGAERIAAERQITCTHAVTSQTAGVACSPAVNNALHAAAMTHGLKPPHMVSGAGHDGVMMSHIADVGMLFVRCRGGVSHSPDEHVEPRDVATAIRVMDAFLES